MTSFVQPSAVRLSGWYLANAAAVGWGVGAIGWQGREVSAVLFAVVLVGLWSIGSMLVSSETEILPARRTSPRRWHRLGAGVVGLALLVVLVTLADSEGGEVGAGVAFLSAGAALVVVPRYHLAVLRLEARPR